MRKSNIFFFVTALFSLYIFFLLLLNLKKQIPSSIEDAEIYLLAKTLITGGSESKRTAFEFVKNNGYIFSAVPILFLTPFALLPFSLYILRIPQLIAGLGLVIILFTFLKNMTPKIGQKNLLIFLITFIIITSPWIQTLILFHLPESLTLILLILSLLLVFKSKRYKKILFFILLPTVLILIAISSLSGFWLSLFLPLSIGAYFRKILNKKRLLIFSVIIYTPLILLFWNNHKFINNFIKEKSFIGQLVPRRLADEINERQKIDYLASDKKFILPSPIRKFIYNKPFLGFEKIYKNFVSYIDFEQYSFPLISYDIVRLSGLLPKGNLPLGFLWDIPIICMGIYIIVINKYKINKKILYFIPILIAPTFFMFKRDFLTSGFALIPFIIILQTLGFIELLDILKKRFNQVFKPIILIASFFISFAIYEQYKLIYTDIFSYQSSALFFYKEISHFLKENANNYSKFIITDKFGPTALMTNFYLDENSDIYWKATKSQKNTKITFENFEFRNINFPNESVDVTTVFIGLPGEFTKTGNNPDQIPLAKDLTLIDKIIAPDELVWQYGQNIWIVSRKN